jgi:phosphoglycerate kinase
MRGISDIDVKGKTVLLRVDLNSPVVNGKIVPGPRIDVHAETIKILSDRGAKLVVLAHQGRKGKPDFLPLEQHAKYIHHIIQKEVAFVTDVIGSEAKEAINRLKDGEILVLDNVRSLECENDKWGKITEALSPMADYFVLDAFSVAHRHHSSVVGFEKKLPCFAGLHLEEEIEALDKLKEAKDITFVLGGSKVDDSFAIMKKWLREGRARKVLVVGALATLLLHAKGFHVGDSMEFLDFSNMESHCEDAKKILEEFDGHIVLPVDVAVSQDMKRIECSVGSIEKGQIWDVGPKTIELYKEAIFHSHTVVMNGPAGVYEIDDFSFGTKKILEAIAQCDAFSLMGGGHTISAIDKFKLNRDHFSHISLAGKALIKYLSGQNLPGLIALEENEKLFPM